MKKQFPLLALVQHFYPELIGKDDNVSLHKHELTDQLPLRQLRKVLEPLASFNDDEVDSHSGKLMCYEYQLEQAEISRETVEIIFSKADNTTVLNYSSWSEDFGNYSISIFFKKCSSLIEAPFKAQYHRQLKKQLKTKGV